MDTSSKAYKLLSLIAISGECSKDVYPFLYLTDSYNEKLMTRLKSDGLIKIHYKDKLRGIRLTRRGKIYYSPCPLNGSPIILQTTVKPTAQEVTCQGDYDFSRLLSPMPCCNAQESLCIQRKSQLYFLGTRKILQNLRFRSLHSQGMERVGSRNHQDQQFQISGNPVMRGCPVCSLLYRRPPDQMGIPDGTKAKGFPKLSPEARYVSGAMPKEYGLSYQSALSWESHGKCQNAHGK